MLFPSPRANSGIEAAPQRSIYVAATSQHVGKTTMTLGLIAALRDQGVDVGYSKPGAHSENY